MKKPDIHFEESLNDDWSKDLSMVEVPIGNASLWHLGVVVFFVVLVVFGESPIFPFERRLLCGASRRECRASAGNSGTARHHLRQRRDALVENKAVFTAVLNAHVFYRGPICKQAPSRRRRPFSAWRPISFGMS